MKKKLIMLATIVTCITLLARTASANGPIAVSAEPAAQPVSKFAVTVENPVLARVDNILITARQVEIAQKSAAFGAAQGAQVEVLDDSAALKAQIVHVLIEKQFEEHDIRLTTEEQEFADGYTDEIDTMLQEALHGPSESEREGARQFLELCEEYMQACGITKEEWDFLAEEELVFSMRYEKLLTQQYQGDKDALMASANERALTLMPEQK